MKLTSNIYFYVVASCLMILASCSKEQVVIPESNDPVFKIEGTLGGEELSLTAGDYNAYMHTSTKLEKGVRVFSGELTDGATSIELGIFDGKVDIPYHIPEIDLATVALKFAKRYPEPLIVLSKDGINQNQNIGSVNWYVNGVSKGNEAAIMEPGKYDICAHVTFIGSPGIIHELCDEIIVGYERSANCSIDYQIGSNSIYASLASTGGAIESVEWFVDGNLAPSSNNTMNWSLTDSNFHTITAKATFANGVVREKSCLVNAANPYQWIPDFTYFEIASGNGFPNQDYRVRLNITRDGREYKSVYANNESSTITLLDLEYFDENSNGNKVFKATVQIEAIVMEMSTEKLIPVNLTATLGIEVP